MRLYNQPKPIVFLGIFLIAIGVSSPSFADKKSAKGVPKQVKALRARINNLQAQIDQIELKPGPQGPQGEAGPQGPAGEQGLMGESGPAGPQGLQGEVGPQGPVGEQGLVGETGPQGPQGETGPQGPTGEQGLTGETGPQGPQGEAGPQGPTGEQGLAGETGPQGPQGEAGPQGPTGEQGLAGETGPAGPQGPAGIDGAQGVAGPVGPQGPAGNNGAQGIAGPVGPQGPAGNDGAQGPVGPAGPQGPAGNDGAQGPVGPVGPQGTPGTDADMSQVNANTQTIEELLARMIAFEATNAALVEEIVELREEIASYTGTATAVFARGMTVAELGEQIGVIAAVADPIWMHVDMPLDNVDLPDPDYNIAGACFTAPEIGYVLEQWYENGRSFSGEFVTNQFWFKRPASYDPADGTAWGNRQSQTMDMIFDSSNPDTWGTIDIAFYSNFERLWIETSGTFPSQSNEVSITVGADKESVCGF